MNNYNQGLLLYADDINLISHSEKDMQTCWIPSTSGAENGDYEFFSQKIQGLLSVYFK